MSGAIEYVRALCLYDHLKNYSFSPDYLWIYGAVFFLFIYTLQWTHIKNAKTCCA